MAVGASCRCDSETGSARREPFEHAAAGGYMANPWTITPLCFGEFPVFEKSVFTYLRNAGEKIRVPILGWLVQSGANAILVDTGPSSPELAEGWHTPIRRTAAQLPASA